MPQIKQETVHGHTISLHKLKNPIPEVRDTPYLYEVRIDGSTDEEQFTRADADAAFDQVITDLNRSVQIANEEANRGRKNGLFGGGNWGGGLF